MGVLRRWTITSKDPLSNSGDGSRPTTDGGVANVGAAEKLATGRAATGEPNSGPANAERMQNKRSDAQAAQADDAVPLGLHGDQQSTTNQEPR